MEKSNLTYQVPYIATVFHVSSPGRISHQEHGPLIQIAGKNGIAGGSIIIPTTGVLKTLYWKCSQSGCIGDGNSIRIVVNKNRTNLMVQWRGLVLEGCNETDTVRVSRGDEIEIEMYLPAPGNEVEHCFISFLLESEIGLQIPESNMQEGRSPKQYQEETISVSSMKDFITLVNSNQHALIRGQEDQTAMYNGEFTIWNNHVGLDVKLPPEKLTLSGDSSFAIEMSPPQNVRVTSIAGGGLTSQHTYFFRIVAVFDNGYMTAGSLPEEYYHIRQFAVPPELSCCIEWDPVPGAESYRIYVGYAEGKQNRYFVSEDTKFDFVNEDGAVYVSADPDGGSIIPGNINAYAVKLSPGSNSWITGGNFGIGTSSPKAAVHIRSAQETLMRLSGIRKADTEWAIRRIPGAPENDKGLAIGRLGAVNQLTNSQEFILSLTFSESGKTGIGIKYPKSELDVLGDIHASGSVIANGKVGIGIQEPQAELDVFGSIRADGNFITNGKVGIRIKEPLAELDVFGNIHASGSVVANGKVGIGIEEPEAELDVLGSIRADGNFITNGKIGIRIREPLAELDVFGNIHASGSVVANGKVGIGIEEPEAELDVLGSIRADGNFITTGKIGIRIKEPLAELDVFGNIHASGSVVANGKVGIGTKEPQAELDVLGNIHASGYVVANGKVGIGIKEPQAELDVLGHIHASGSIVTMGFVGIGTPKPAAPLDVNGTIIGGGTSEAWFVERTAGLPIKGHTAVWKVIPGLSQIITLKRPALVLMNANGAQLARQDFIHVGYQFRVDGAYQGEGDYGQMYVVTDSTYQRHITNWNIDHAVNLPAGDHTIEFHARPNQGGGEIASHDGAPLKWLSARMVIRAVYN